MDTVESVVVATLMRMGRRCFWHISMNLWPENVYLTTAGELAPPLLPGLEK